ncbi:hypothetical protein ACFFMN_33270 [Planobispora siamensis]|uniref:Uncharacterized protein n=1 Tax=Planobispora siamensis TaxID=936338 RepID=A0A8J3SM33_9ACTN|nr:hypothetical protein [Planobispora siamensis]GIH92083.1 hypothetical protein Psi01_27130 [Planobispora siamensis]
MSAPSDPTQGTSASLSGVADLEHRLQEVVPSDGRVAEQREASGLRQEPGLRQETPGPQETPGLQRDVQFQLTRGRYRSGGQGYQLELRVDVDGVRPQNRVSADFFSTSGGTTSYFGSFIVHFPTVTVTAAQVVLQGTGSFTFNAGAPVVRVTVPRRTTAQPQGDATVQFLTASGQPGAGYVCPFVSPYFRSVVLEQDSVTGAVPFVSYDTSALPQPPTSPSRVLTVVKSYAEAGIELQMSGFSNIVATSAAGPDLLWNDAELHNAMVQHFSGFANVAQWRLWMLVASAHTGGYRGIMFDYNDACQRQGAAVFYNAIQGNTPQAQRAQLRTYVHEIGHAFNLLHSWQKNLAVPPQPLGPNGGFGDLSWMNYVQNYQPLSGAGGEAAYWAAFPFQFTDSELVHLRHANYRDVIMGANAFGTGAAEIAPELFDEPVEDQSGLALEVRAKEAFAFGEPVVVELKLSTTDLRGRNTHSHLHPDTDFTHVAVTQPSGRTVLYRPMLRHCSDDAAVVRLDQDNPAIYRSAYIGHGADGHYFQQPGEYRVRAQYLASDGSRIVSPVCRIRVRYPVTQADQEVAELMMGEESGKLLTLLGSDSPALASGNAALQEVIDKHGKHPLAVYARMVRGVNAEREFKNLTADNELTIRQPDTKESIQQLTLVADASARGEGVDNITLNMVMRRLAGAQAKQGDLEQATGTIDKMVRTFEGKQLRPSVLEQIRRQAERTKAALASETKERPAQKKK